MNGQRRAGALIPLFSCPSTTSWGIGDIADFAPICGESSMLADDRAALDAVRASPCIDYVPVRRLKRAALGASFARFVDAEWKRDSARARDFRTFVAQQAWWIEDYSLFRAIHAREGERPWTEWPIELQNREPAAIDRARRELAQDVL